MESKLLMGGKNIVDHTNEQQRALEQRRNEIAEQKVIIYPQLKLRILRRTELIITNKKVCGTSFCDHLSVFFNSNVITVEIRTQLHKPSIN